MVNENRGSFEIVTVQSETPNEIQPDLRRGTPIKELPDKTVN
jgi:hypothetical protein